MATHILRIPDWLPASVNRLIRNRFTGARLKRADRDMIAVYAILAGVPDATARRRVSIELRVPNTSRAPDPDNCLKSALDGCVRAGLLRDDSARWCELGPVEVRKGERRMTTITLEDCPITTGAPPG